MTDASTLYTIGHSNRSLDELFQMLADQGIQRLIDVRSLPHSQRNPRFDQNMLQLACDEEGIRYFWLGKTLGGMRHQRPDSPHSALTSSGFRGYADYMTSPSFSDGMQQLKAIARPARSVIMCAERDPTQCHRSLIADYLTLNHWRVIHLLDAHSSCGHCLHPKARIQENSKMPIYDVLDQEQLTLGL